MHSLRMPCFIVGKEKVCVTLCKVVCRSLWFFCLCSSLRLGVRGEVTDVFCGSWTWSSTEMGACAWQAEGLHWTAQQVGSVLPSSEGFLGFCAGILSYRTSKSFCCPGVCCDLRLFINFRFNAFTISRKVRDHNCCAMEHWETWGQCVVHWNQY